MVRTSVALLLTLLTQSITFLFDGYLKELYCISAIVLPKVKNQGKYKLYQFVSAIYTHNITKLIKSFRIKK